MTNINVTKRLTRTGIRWRIEASADMGQIDAGLVASIELSDADTRALWGKLGSDLEVATPDPDPNCSECGGLGKVGDTLDDCPECDGTGKRRKK